MSRPAIPTAALTSPSAEEISSLVAAQRAHASAVSQTGPKQRIRKLTRLRDALLARRDDIRGALRADLRKPVVETDLTEIMTTINEIDHACDHLSNWMTPTRVEGSLLYAGTRSEIHYEPKGVVLVMAPWNYPLNLTLGPLVSAIAAGNCVVLKPSEHAPATEAVMQELIGNLYDRREIAVVTGGPDVAEALTHQPFDHIYFTGSPATGRRVMKAAADHLTSVTLELGGKSPAIVDRTADLDQAAGRLAWSKFVNAGQTCIAPDYLLVEASVHDEMIERLRKRIHEFYGPSPTAQRESDDYARLVHEDHYNAVVDLLAGALEAGATVATGGHRDAKTRFVAPTVLTDVPLDVPIMQEEIFGPLLPVISYQTLDAALRVVNDRPSPLSLYLFTEREATVESVLNRTTAGSTCVNEGFIHFNNPALPFGGKGESGIGRGHGRHGFEAFSNQRSVLRRSHAAGVIDLFYPPYGQLVRRLIDMLTRWS